MDVCLLLVLSGRGLCVGLITRQEESYRVWCVSLSVILKPRWGPELLGLSGHEKKKTLNAWQVALIVRQPLQVQTLCFKRTLRVWRMALLIKRPVNVHTFTYTKALTVWQTALLIKRPVNVHTFTYTKALTVWQTALLIKRPVNVHTFTYTKALTVWRMSLLIRRPIHIHPFTYPEKAPLHNSTHGCNREATRCTRMHTKKLPVVMPPPLLNSNRNCQTDRAFLFPTFYLNPVSMYGLRNKLTFLNHAATAAKHTYYSNDTGAFQKRFVLTAWAFRAFKMTRAARANANPAWPAADRYK